MKSTSISLLQVFESSSEKSMQRAEGPFRENKRKIKRSFKLTSDIDRRQHKELSIRNENVPTANISLRPMILFICHLRLPLFNPFNDHFVREKH